MIYPLSCFPQGEVRAFRNCSVSNFSEGACLPRRNLPPWGKAGKGVLFPAITVPGRPQAGAFPGVRFLHAEMYSCNTLHSG